MGNKEYDSESSLSKSPSDTYEEQEGPKKLSLKYCKDKDSSTSSSRSLSSSPCQELELVSKGATLDTAKGEAGWAVQKTDNRADLT